MSDEAGSTPELTVDARRLLCPLPLLRTQDAVRGLKSGTEVEVMCTDRGVLNDIPAWCRVQGHVYLGATQDGREIRIRLRTK